MAAAIADGVGGGGNEEQDDSDDNSIVNKNPLLIDVVLRKVFDCLPQDNLKICRQVNLLWNNIADVSLRQKCSHISFNNDNYWTNMANHGIEEMVQFIQCAKASISFPFVKFDLGTSLIKLPPDELILTDFLETVCQQTTELTFRDEWGQQLYKNGPPAELRFPVLEVFRIHFLQPMCNDEDISCNFQFVTNVLEHAPALKRLILVDHNGMDDGKVVTCFIDSIEKANAKKIVRLEIEAQIESHHLIQLSSMGLKLKHLYLDFWGSLINDQSLKLFLTSQSSNLEHFKIADFAMSSDFVVDFPCMKNLKSLMIKGSLLGRICISFPNISYEKQFPVLKRLSFSNAMDEWDEFLKYGIKPVDTVEELKLPADFADAFCLQHAARIFPKIRKLEIPALLNLACIVYDMMPNIEELILNTKYIDGVDDIITGLSIEVCEEVRMFPEPMFNTVERDHMRLITTKPISCLERLTILRLKCKRQTDPVELTDVSCRLVLLKMKALKCLDLWGRRPAPRVTASVLLAMKQKFTVLC
ncbi:hypothetical protein Ocin01_09157 [Orchesella cincta]|uniref:F-box domain-containing protein n=1 Tax=Orchesella cincta TaxID=48709 RepID=A0A1D2MX42_ORCCI|nr:hypothetical protein Ocin01_09157 [Orchesella cincta]